MNLNPQGPDYGTERVLLLMGARLRRLALLFAVGLCSVFGAYWYFQVVRAEHYFELAENNRLRVIRLDAPRGLILDRDDRLLAENTPAFGLLIDRSLSADMAASIQFASEVLDLDEVELERALQRYVGVPRDVPVLLAEELELTEVARFGVAAPEHPEFQVSVSHRRLYRYGVETAHLLGYLGEPTRSDEERDPSLEPNDLVGRSGVEHVRDGSLRGEAGERIVVVDSRGRMMTGEDVDRRNAVPGESVRLTIDLPLQQLAQDLLTDRVGAIVALDPRDGALRAMASSPSFDPNDFVRRLDPEVWRRIVELPDRPLQNRAIHNAYPPGSVFKIAVAVAALSEDSIDAEERVFCGGTTRLFGRRWRCWRQQGHGSLDLAGALRHSCDIYFYRQGVKLGIEAIARYARMLGLGRRTGVELPGDREGLVPDPEWSRERRGTPWYPGETVSVAIGQGPLLTTPLQVATMTAAIANGGNLVRPYIVAGGAEPSESVGVAPEAIAQVGDALVDVVENGTGRSARSPLVRIAGKTGTAQVVAQATWTRSEDLPPEHADHAWFTSYAPANAPELVVVVFVENGGRGSEVAAPMARQLHEGYFGDSPRT